MSDLVCKHCDMEIGYADAVIADAEGWECPEPRPYPDHPEMLDHEHEWEEIRA